MSKSANLAECYQKIKTINDEMLLCSQHQQWDEVIRLNIDYLESVEHVAACQRLDPSNETEFPQMKQIIANESIIKERLQARMNVLKDSMIALRHQSKGNIAYLQQSVNKLEN